MQEDSLILSKDQSDRTSGGVCDCHVHVFEPQQFRYADSRSYTPGPAIRGDLETFLETMGSERVVLVQPSVYGTDNRCLLDSLKSFDGRGRAVAVIDPAATGDDVLSALKDAGVQALRVNFEASPSSATEDRVQIIERTAVRAAQHGLKLQIFSKLETIVSARSSIERLGVKIILDHFAGLTPSHGIESPAFVSLLEMLRGGNVWVKLSAPSRVSTTEDHSDLVPFVTKLVELAPGRLIWGSDWPHTGGSRERADRAISEIEPFRDIDDRATLDRLKRWIGDAQVVRQILIENPAKLFDF